MRSSSQFGGGFAQVWLSGKTYRIGERATSPTNLREYVRKTNGAGATDPSSDATNWRRTISIPATKYLGFGFNVAGFNELGSIQQVGRSAQTINYSSPSSLASNSFSTMFSFSGPLSITHLGISRSNASNMTWSARITVDDSVIFDRSSAPGSSANYGLVFAGRESEAYSSNAVNLPPIIAHDYILIEWKHSISALGTPLLQGNLIYQELQ